jgi:hypothetical protein
VPGSINPYVDCSGASNSDTVVNTFTDHASALAYAHWMLAVGNSLGMPTAEVVGPNWVVNAVPLFARKVVQAGGGQLISTAAASSSPPPAAAVGMTYPNQPADAALCKTYNTDISRGDTYDIEAALQHADGLVSPKLARDIQAVVNGTTSRKIIPWTAEWVDALHNGLPGAHRVLVDLGSGLGLRQGECFGLAVDDVDFLRRVVHVRHQVKIVRAKLVFGRPKGDKVRDVPLPDTVALALAAHLKQHPAQPVTLP